MTMQVKLIVPNHFSPRNGDELGADHDPVQNYGPDIARMAGGFTATTNGWISPSDDLIVGPVTVFDIQDSADTVAELVASHKEDWRIFARRIARELNQESVYLSFDGEAEFIGQ
jgi:hypothetical protein